MLRCEDYRLRGMVADDLEKVLEWRNSERIRVNMFTDRIITIEEHRAWFARLEQDNTRLCKIFEFHERSVGLINFTDLDRANNKCSWGFYLGETGLPPGTGSIMGFMGLQFAFEKLGIRKLCGEVLAFNKASIKFHEKLGFDMEGRLVKYVLKKWRIR